MSRIDLVLLHAPSVYDFRERSIMSGPVSDMVPSTPAFEMYPLGFTTMADYLERHGFEVRIVNLAVLMLNRPTFDVEKAIREMDPVAFGIDLHWMPHAHGSVEIAKLCKKYHPDTPVIFGGLTSTYFHEELASYPAVDHVLRGDSTEEPLRRLMTAIRGRGSVADIPNLTWKGPDGSVNVNPLTWVPPDMNGISLDYSYAMRGVIRYRDMVGFVPFRSWLSYPVCASLTSRGCTHDCATCGGSAYAFRTHFGRDRIAFRDPELLVHDIAHIQKFIPGPIFVLNDFLQAGPDYIDAFVRGLGRIGLRNPIGFEFFRPPDEGFYAFLDEHLPDYSVEISVESHDDAVRAAFGKRHYTIDGRRGVDPRGAAARLQTLRPVLHDRDPVADRGECARDRRLRARALRAHRQRRAAAALHLADGALPRPGQQSVRRSRGVRLHPSRPHARGAPAAAAPALVARTS